MIFPVYLRVGSLVLHPHWVFESLAYFVGFRLYMRLRRKQGDPLDFSARMWIVAAAAAGAALASKVLYWLSDPVMIISHWRDPAVVLGGKSIVGGLIGGLIAVEYTKRRLRIIKPTGDLFAMPIAVGIAIGRIGCFLTGLQDHTYGLPTSMPWGIDFGDGVPRHPVQLYEIAWLLVLAFGLTHFSRRAHVTGDLFKGFMVGYAIFRLSIEWLKPGIAFGGLTAIQWACAGLLLYYCRDIARWLRLIPGAAHA